MRGAPEEMGRGVAGMWYGSTGAGGGTGAATGGAGSGAGAGGSVSATGAGTGAAPPPNQRDMKPPAEVARIWRDKGIAKTDHVIVYCQVGMRASYDLWTLALLGHDLSTRRNYYGAWEEWGNRDDTPIVDGWLDTGDLGFMYQGELYISGRAKDLLILRGRNHAPQEVEHAVDVLEGVRTGCSAARPSRGVRVGGPKSRGVIAVPMA